MQTEYKRFLVEHKHGVNWVQTSTLASQGLLGMVGGPAHGQQVDVVQLAACARARGALVTFAILEELLLAMSHRPFRSRPPPYTSGGCSCGGPKIEVYSQFAICLQLKQMVYTLFVCSLHNVYTAT